ncbi:MAG: aldo/keto reductase [Rhodothermaceae bacterium]|nr:aldo/keto reductase [Rhodothermaceae bacterium]
MTYTTLGNTGLQVSRMCLGCMSYGDSSWRPWILQENEARPFFERAINEGINFFDTADMYSLGVSEEVTGKLLREMTTLDEVVIATKVYFPMRGEQPNMGGLSRKHIVQACEASLERLGIDTIDLYQIHRLDPHTPVEETLAALDHLVQQGKVRYLGTSSMYAWQLMKALSISERNGWARFVSMQNHYNLVYREEEREMIPLCKDQGIGTIPWSPLARGLLARPASGNTTSRLDSDTITPRLYDAPGDREVIQAVENIAIQRGESMATIALAWLLARPTVVAPIVGLTKLSHFDDALRALDITLSEEECAELEAPYQPHSVKGHS